MPNRSSTISRVYENVNQSLVASLARSQSCLAGIFASFGSLLGSVGLFAEFGDKLCRVDFLLLGHEKTWPARKAGPNV